MINIHITNNNPLNASTKMVQLNTSLGQTHFRTKL